jgi:hypothetical protein
LSAISTRPTIYRAQIWAERGPIAPCNPLGAAQGRTRQAIRRGSFTSVKDLIVAIETFIDGWNDRCQPFVWTKTADQILPHATGGQRTFTWH